MILVVTNRDDLTADWLILELERRGADFVRFNTEDYPEHVRLAWRTSGATLSIRGRRVDLAAVTAVWFRRPVVELPRGESREITEVAGEHDGPPDRGDDEEDLQIETTRTFVEREDDEPRSWAHVVGQTRTETSVEREAPDRDDW